MFADKETYTGGNSPSDLAYWGESYDLDTIMHYLTYQFDDKILNSVDECSMAMWIDRGPDFNPLTGRKITWKDVERIIPPYRPSKKDAIGIKHLYAWYPPMWA